MASGIFSPGGIFPTTIAFPQTVQNAMAALFASAQGTNGGVGACTALDSQTRAGWAAFYAALTALNEQVAGISFWTPGLGSLLDQIDSYSTQLASWQKLLGQKCSLGTPVFDPAPQDPRTAQWLSIAEWAVAAVIVVAGAYVVSEVVAPLERLIPERRG